MKIVRIRSGNGHYRDVRVPETWKEAETMLIDVMGKDYDDSGGDATRNSIAGRVVFGMFGEQFGAPNPTVALNFLLQRICQRKGAGLDK